MALLNICSGKGAGGNMHLYICIYIYVYTYIVVSCALVMFQRCVSMFQIFCNDVWRCFKDVLTTFWADSNDLGGHFKDISIMIW